MKNEMNLCHGMHHTAYRCINAKQTVDFYVETLGLDFIHAMGGNIIPSTGEYNPHCHVFLQLADWIRNFAFRVNSREQLLQEKSDFKTKDIPILVPVNHDYFLFYLYFLTFRDID